MIKSKTVEIIKDIYTDDIDPEDKLTAIQEIVNMETINSITKVHLVGALRWLVYEYL